MNNRFENFDPNNLEFKNNSTSSEDSSMLKSIILKIEKLEDDKVNISEEIKDTFLSAKNEGFDPAIIKKVLKIRKMKPEKVQEEELLIQHYKKILGMK